MPAVPAQWSFTRVVRVIGPGATIVLAAPSVNVRYVVTSVSARVINTGEAAARVWDLLVVSAAVTLGAGLIITAATTAPDVSSDSEDLSGPFIGAMGQSVTISLSPNLGFYNQTLKAEGYIL